MNRKEINHLAIDLIEEALEKPNQTIVLEERIANPICEPGMKEQTEEELDRIRTELMYTINYLSLTPIYEFRLGVIHKVQPLILQGECSNIIVYENDSKIQARR